MRRVLLHSSNLDRKIGATVVVPQCCAYLKTEKSRLGWWNNHGGASKTCKTFAWSRSPVVVGLVSMLKEQKLPKSRKSSCQQSSIMVLAGCIGKVSKWPLYLEHRRWCFSSRGISLQACWRHIFGVLCMAPVHSRKASFGSLTRESMWDLAEKKYASIPYSKSARTRHW